MKRIPFVKMHGLGNDFIIVDSLIDPFPIKNGITPELAIRMCDRRFGIGADQVLWLHPSRSEAADARMTIINVDGMVAEMCGNGVRAAGVYLYKYGPNSGQKNYLIETLAGIKPVQIQDEADELKTLSMVDMGAPAFGAGFNSEGEELTLPLDISARFASLNGRKLSFYEINMGNPHAVIFVEDVRRFPVEEFGPIVEHHERFPEKTNVEFAQVVGKSELMLRIWERGAGMTLACGSGACAAVVASIMLGKINKDVKVKMPGGQLRVIWPGIGNTVFMEGPAEEVFRGEYLI